MYPVIRNTIKNLTGGMHLVQLTRDPWPPAVSELRAQAAAFEAESVGGSPGVPSLLFHGGVRPWRTEVISVAAGREKR